MIPRLVRVRVRLERCSGMRCKKLEVIEEVTIVGVVTSDLSLSALVFYNTELVAACDALHADRQVFFSTFLVWVEPIGRTVGRGAVGQAIL